VRNVLGLAALCAALGCQAGAAQPISGEAVAPYRIECLPAPAGCRADLATYIGWRVFQAQCATCHAADPNVAPYYDELWSFLRARLAGDLPAGPVERLPDGDDQVGD